MLRQGDWWQELIAVPETSFSAVGSINLGDTIKNSNTRAALRAQTVSQAVRHIRVRNAVLDPVSGCWFHDGSLLPHTAGLLYPQEEADARQRAQVPRFEIRNRHVFSIFHRWGSCNYGHWIAQVLPSLFHFMADPEFESSVLLLPKMPFTAQRASLECLLRELPDHKFIEENEAVYCDDVTISSLTVEDLPGAPVSSQLIYDLMVDRVSTQSRSAPAASPLGIYYWRADSAARLMRNEADLIQMLASFGIVPVICGDMAFPDQVSTFSSASLVIGAHGAGLLNIAFCRPGTTVYELFPSHFIPPLANRIAQARGLTYWADQFPSEQPEAGADRAVSAMADDMFKRRAATWLVDIPLIKERIDRILSYSGQ